MSVLIKPLDVDVVVFRLRFILKVLNALDTRLPRESFDLVWSLESGEHMPDKDDWLKEIARLLRPG